MELDLEKLRKLGEKVADCPRCMSIDRKPMKAVHKMIGPNGINTRICDLCYNEILEEENFYFTHEKPKGKTNLQASS